MPDSHYLRASQSRPSDLGSLSSAAPPSRWWTFTLPRPTAPFSQSDDNYDSLKHEKKIQNSLKDRSMSWLPTSSSAAFREGSSFARKLDKLPAMSERRDINLSIAMPLPPPSLTLAHAETPGWETPWTARVGAQGPHRSRRPEEDDEYNFGEIERTSTTSSKKLSKWQRRKKYLRTFILSNTYVPLVCITTYRRIPLTHPILLDIPLFQYISHCGRSGCSHQGEAERARLWDCRGSR